MFLSAYEIIYTRVPELPGCVLMQVKNLSHCCVLSNDSLESCFDYISSDPLSLRLLLVHNFTSSQFTPFQLFFIVQVLLVPNNFCSCSLNCLYSSSTSLYRYELHARMQYRLFQLWLYQ